MGKKKILIIEDDEDMCEEMQSLLIDEGYAVDITNDGRAGIEYTRKSKYDLILLDLKLPKMNGYEALKLIKAARPRSRIIVLTGSPLQSAILPEDETSIREKEYKESRLKLADDIINKPFNVNIVIDRIKSLIS